MLSGYEVVDNGGSDLGDSGRTERSGWTLDSFEGRANMIC